MSKIKTNPDEIWKEKGRAERYNLQPSIDLYERVKRNEQFYIGDQWAGVKAPDLEKPVLNFLRRVVTYFISMIVSDDVAVSFGEFRATDNGDIITKLMADEVDRVVERTKMKARNREGLRYAAVDGKVYSYFWFDQSIDTGRLGSGEIKMDLVSNTRVLFGNPYIAEVQEQPYILIIKRSKLEEIQERAKANGVPVEEIDQIKADNEAVYDMDGDTDDLVTSVIKLYKQRKQVPVYDPSIGVERMRTVDTVWHTEVTDKVVIRKPTDTGYQLYPLASMTWETIKNSYQGQAAITGLITNQIYVNKMWAMLMAYTQLEAFPVTFYDRTKIDGLNNRPGGTVPVYGDPSTAIPRAYRSPDISNQVLAIVDKTISYTRDFMGASDAALGNVRPDNTSAIIAVQKASSAPLELQRMSFYQYIEDSIRVIIDIVRSDYGLREVSYDDGAGHQVTMPFDFSQIDYDALELNVDVGAASYWSELTRVQTADNLFSKGIITDAVDYLEAIPDQYIPHKNKLIAKLQERAEAPQQADPQIGGVASGAMSQLSQLPIN